jgi:hypothetical protein
MVRNWEQMISAFDRHLEEIPQFRSEVEALRTQLVDVKRFDDEQERLKALRADAMNERNKHGDAGTRIYGRLQATLQGYYGKQSETLFEFGLRPLRPGRRSLAQAVEDAAPPPAQAPRPDTA